MATNMSSEFSELLRSLYGSVIAEQPWYDFLVEFRDYLDAQYATLIVTRSTGTAPSLMVTPRGDPQHIAQYCESLFRIDPFNDIPEGEVHTLCDFHSEETLQKTPYYEAHIRDVDTEHVLAFDLRTRGFVTRVRVTRTAGRPPFGRDERLRCEELMPHIRLAMEIFEKLEISRNEQAIYSSTMAQFAVGSILLGEDGDILQTNEIADAVLTEADGIKRVGRRLVFAHAALDSEFRELLGRARTSPGDSPVLRVERPSGKRELAIFARATSSADYLRAGGAATVAIYLVDPGRQSGVTPQAVRSLFDMTPMEGEIAARLANGASVSEAADDLQISVHTVRAHLRSIFGKLEITRQSQLVHLIHTSLPELTVTARRSGNA